MKRILILAMACAAVLCAQNPLSDDARGFYNSVKNNITRSAEQMPEANYAWKPTPDVRSFGELIGHVVDWQYNTCGPLRGVTKASSMETGQHTKAELLAALKEAFAFCDVAFAALTDATAAQPIQQGARTRTRLMTAAFNFSHLNEHYGNIVTYLRLKGLVPPSSQPRQ